MEKDFQKSGFCVGLMFFSKSFFNSNDKMNKIDSRLENHALPLFKSGARCPPTARPIAATARQIRVVWHKKNIPLVHLSVASRNKN